MLHQHLTTELWATKPLEYQMGNIGSEVVRFLGLVAKQRIDEANKSLERACELLDLSISVQHSSTRKRELEQIKTLLISFNQSEADTQTMDQINNYFLPYAILARKNT